MLRKKKVYKVKNHFFLSVSIAIFLCFSAGITLTGDIFSRYLSEVMLQTDRILEGFTELLYLD